MLIFFLLLFLHFIRFEFSSTITTVVSFGYSSNWVEVTSNLQASYRVSLLGKSFFKTIQIPPRPIRLRKASKETVSLIRRLSYHPLQRRHIEESEEKKLRGVNQDADSPRTKKKTGHDFRVPTSDFRRPIFEFRLPSSDFRVTTSELRLPSYAFRVPTSEFRLPSSDFPHPTSDV